jgi:hypothetical protein
MTTATEEKTLNLTETPEKATSRRATKKKETESVTPSPDVPAKTQSLDSLCIIYYPDREKPRVQWAAGNPDVSAVRHREIAVEVSGQLTTLNFIPGPNFSVDKKLWDLAKKIPATKQKIKDGVFYEITPTTVEQEENTLGYNISDVEEIVSTIYEVDLLKQWQAKDTRPEVYKLIERRIQEVAA